MSLYAGDKVYLRAVERGDIERGHRWINDWEVRQYLMPGPAYPISVDESRSGSSPPFTQVMAGRLPSLL